MDRSLIYVPIRHNYWAGELGTVRSSLDCSELERRAASYDGAWDEIFSRVIKQPVVHQYQDGNPFSSGHNQQKVLNRASKSSPNIRTINRLLEKGVVLEKTESLIWLAVYFIQGYLRMDVPYFERKREESIARNIDRTLQPGECGVLFIGAAHKVDRVIQRNHPDISIEYCRIDWDKIDIDQGLRSPAEVELRHIRSNIT